jgi:hypothetical protein
MIMTQTNRDMSTNLNVIDYSGKNDSVETKSTNVQNRTSTGNENTSLMTVSQTVETGHPDTRQLRSEQTSQRAAPNHDETKPTKQPRLNARRSINVEKDRKKVNRTTFMMFLITLMYVTTWIINWSTQIYKTATDINSLKTDFLTERLYMINCMTNPIFYIFMSSKFKQNAKELFCK